MKSKTAYIRRVFVLRQAMIFTPTLKRKKGPPAKTLTIPLPECSSEELCDGIFTGFSVEVNNPDHIRTLYDCGCFGKGSKSRSCPGFLKQNFSPNIEDTELVENLALDLEESFFLAHYLKVLRIDDINGIELTSEQLLSKFTKVKLNFVDCFVAYLYLRSKNWIVKSGTKFGSNFLIYKKGPRYFHASFMVFASRGEGLLPKDLKGLQRIAETSDKDLLFLEISSPPCEDSESDILQNLHKFRVSENIVKRFNYSAFAQTK